MIKKFKISIPIRKRILLHLADYVNLRDAYEVDNAVTQQGIADAINIRPQHISRSVKNLVNDEYIYHRSSPVKGFNRKKKAYFLTAKGIEHSKEIKKWFNNQLVLVRTLGGEIREIRFSQLEKILNYKIKPLKIFKYISVSKEGIIDLKQIISNIKQIDPTFEIKQDYTEIISLSKKDYIFPDNILNIENFFGRTKELNQLKIWIDNKDLYRFIIISGIAGIGKSALALRLSKEYKNTKHIFWHNLNPRDSVRSVLSHIAEFLSDIGDEHLKSYINLNKPLDFDKILDLFEKQLNNLNAILIFDDFHKVNEGLRNFFASIIEILEKTGNVKFIILTRYNIPFYAQQKVLVKKSVAELEIEGLDFESSVEILRRKDHPKNRYKDIHNKTAGNPLLLEIFESSKKTKRYIHEEIFLKLTEEEQTIMEILSPYEVPISYDAFFINNKILPKTINNLIQKLIIKETSDGFYNAHEFIKDHFYKRLNPYAKRQYHELCAKYYIKQKKPKYYLEAIYHYIKSQRYQIAMDLAIKKAQDIIDRGLSERFLAVLEELAEKEVILPQGAEILILKAQLGFIIGDWDKSLRYYHRAVEVGNELGKEDIKAKAYCEIGHIFEEQNLIGEALENFQKSLKISTKIKDIKRLAEAKRGIGRYYWRKSNYDTAEKYYKESLNALKNIDDFKLIGAIHIDLGNIYFQRDKYDQAIEYLKKALYYLEEIDDKLEIARNYNSLGTVHTYSNKFEDAILYFKKQLDIVEAIGDITLIGYGLSNIGYCYAKQNQVEKAKKYIDRAIQISNMINNENILFTTFKTNGLIFQYYGDWDKAIDNFNKSLKIVKKLNAPFYLAITLFEFGSLYEEKGDLANAKKYYQEVYSIYQETGQVIPNRLESKLLEFNGG